jgi:hypothetical protein
MNAQQGSQNTFYEFINSRHRQIETIDHHRELPGSYSSPPERVVHMNSKGNGSNPVFFSGVHGISSAMCTSWSGWIIIMKSSFTAAGRRQSFGKLRTGSEVVN